MSIELIELTKKHKLFKLYDKMKNKTELITNNTLFYYIILLKTVQELVDMRKKLILEFFQPTHYQPTIHDFYDTILFNKNAIDIRNYFNESNLYVQYIINNWNHFNPIINTFLFD
uniref:Uncharacterized protein n=1 Tax=viral metagenome TaxID=1070528 RepID=A0A6C0AXQ1_9ZZZZ|tara:strand:+ start:2943 stop:3287 length:345 start_codon:yes stop_codon:yes gene_type:complete